MPTFLQRPGPSVDTAFLVMSGLATVATAHGFSVVIPTGGCWPGALSEPLASHVRAAETFLSQEATIRPATHDEQTHGTALVTAQALTSIGTLISRKFLLQQLAAPMNTSTAALCVGSTRPAFSAARVRGDAGAPRPQRRNTRKAPVRFDCERLCVTRALLLRLDTAVPEQQFNPTGIIIVQNN
jgi:hypothetical protein